VQDSPDPAVLLQHSENVAIVERSAPAPDDRLLVSIGCSVAFNEVPTPPCSGHCNF
jgi:hypothetical protein